MKALDLKSTDENVVKTFIEDALGRSGDVCSFVNLLHNVEGAYSIGLDGRWGTGKTFFVKQSKLVLDSFNQNVVQDNVDLNKIQLACRKWVNDTEVWSNDPYITAYYDAWEHDNENDPILSLVYEIMKDNHNNANIENKKSWGKILTSIAETITGRELSKVIESIEGENIFDKPIQNEEIRSIINDFFKSMLCEKGNKLVIFIDELDRCTPTYAIKVLERVKHYFSNENIIFVFSVNFHELQKTVKKFYGTEFDACRYLDRFFDWRVEIPPVDLDSYYSGLGFGDRYNHRFNVCTEMMRLQNMSLRDSSKYLSMTKAAAYKFTDGMQRGMSRDDGTSELVEYTVIVPIVLCLKLTGGDEYKSFMEGKDSSWLIKIMKLPQLSWLMNSLLEENETYKECEGKVKVNKVQKIEEVYQAIFGEKYTDASEYEICIGHAIFDRESKNKILRAISFGSKYTDLSRV